MAPTVSARRRGAALEGADRSMSPVPSESEGPLLERALRAARDTRFLAVEPGVRHDVAPVFASLFGTQTAVIVADERTFAAAGCEVLNSFRRASHACADPVILGPHVY